MPSKTGPLRYQVNDYPSFISNINKSNLYSTVFNLAEISHIIEKIEYDIFLNSRNLAKNNYSKKKYRQDASQRQNVLSAIKTSWSLIQKLSENLGLGTSEIITPNDLIQSLSNGLIDSYDALILKLLDSKGMNKVITDDYDFATMPNLIIYTANNQIISEAQSKNLLLP